MPDLFDLPPRPGPSLTIADWYIDGRLRADTSNAQGKVVRLPDYANPLILSNAISNPSMFGALATTSAGAAVTLDIKHASSYEGTRTSIFFSAPTIAIGDVHTTDTSSTPGIIAPHYLYVDGGFWWFYVTQVGSTALSEGIDLTFSVMAKVYAE